MENISYEGHIEALTKISKAITSDLYLDDILRLIVTVTAEIMKSNICSLWLLDEKDNSFKLRATQSISKEYIKERKLKVGEGIVSRVAKEKKAIAVPDVLKDPNYKEKELARKEKLCSMLGVPTIVRGKVTGVITCYTAEPHLFTETEINILTSVANQAAVAIENTELMVRTRVIQEELKARKEIERAKGILMKEQGLTEEEAYLKLQKYSMDKRQNMQKIAEAIIMVSEMKNGNEKKIPSFL